MNLPPLSYKESGSGTAVVFLHGFCENKELWSSFQEHLSKRYRVICPDLPGHGESPLKKKDITIEYMADKVNELLKFLSIDKCVMIGHSLGGYVMLAFAERFEDKLLGIGMFHSTAFADSPEKRRTRNKTVDFIEKHGPARFGESFVAPLFYEPNRERLKDTINKLIKVVANTSKDGIIAATLAMRDRKGRTDVLQDTTVPVLFIIGEEDSAVPLEVSMELASMPPKVIKHILPQTGHMGMFEKEEETKNIVEEFLTVVI